MSKQSIPASRGPVKMRDIAQLAGVSTATVSRTLHNSERVDPETAKRVRAVIEKMNYVPNATGTVLKSGRSGIYGLVIPDIANPFFSDFLKYFEREIVNREQEMLLAITDHSPEQMQRSVRRMLMRGVEGMVILESEIETQSFETMLHNQIPLVTLNRLLVEPGVSDIAIDATSGMTAAAAHLKQLGHRRIGFLGGKGGRIITSARETSFRDAMRANGLNVRESAVLFGEFTLEGGSRAMREMLDVRPAVTAVICANDLSAIGAMRTLAERGLVPGKEVSLVGLDDIDLCTMVTPQLSTLRISREHLAGLYFEALTGLVRKPHQLGKQLFQDVQLVLRGTTGPAPSKMRKHS